MSARLAALGACLACLLAAGCSAPQPPSEPAPRDRAQHRHLLVVLDGLRPDYVEPALMPNLHALAGRGVVFTDHHAVYPTVTRVNAASIATGAYPETHGLLGNAVFFPRVDATRFLSTADRANLLRIERAEAGRLLTAPTLGERLAGAGLRLLVASAGSSGSSYLLNPTLAGGGIIHYEYALPAALGRAVRERLGPRRPPPCPTAPATGTSSTRFSKSVSTASIPRSPSSGSAIRTPPPTPGASGIRPPSPPSARWTRSWGGSRPGCAPPAAWRRSTSG